jgi:hypothetical protein
MLVTVSIFFGSGCWLIFTLFWIRMLVTLQIIFHQPVGDCSHYIESCWWLLFPLCWIRLLVIVSIILDQVVS